MEENFELEIKSYRKALLISASMVHNAISIIVFNYLSLEIKLSFAFLK